MTRTSFFVRSDNVSAAWCAAFRALLEPGVTDLAPLVVNLLGFDGGTPKEDDAIRGPLDRQLGLDPKHCLSSTTAGLIFPENLWKRYERFGRDAFFARYLEVTLPRLKQADKRNSRGTYFARMLGFGASPVNQLKQILDSRDGGNARRSALQLAIFDPAFDHSNQPYMGFPCLDHITFAPDSAGGLSVTALYANQYVFDRAYGNYLGLAALGRFVAGQLNLEFRQLTCIAGVAQIGDLGKEAARSLVAEMPACSAYELVPAGGK